MTERLGEIVGYAIHSRFFEYDILELLVVRPKDRRTRVVKARVTAVDSRSRTGNIFTSTNQSNTACSDTLRSTWLRAKRSR